MDSLLSLVEKCYQRLPTALREKPWLATDHGRKVLQTEEELDAYIAAYGEMHVVKCRAALQNFPFNDLKDRSYEIFDWGCGQGLAALTLLDMLKERYALYGLKKIYLIEPSSHALNRAKAWVEQCVGKNVEVITVNQYIPQDADETMPDVFCSSRTSINLFSNILDIKSINLSWLANKTAALADENYMICVGPKYSVNTRIADFCGYFNPQEYFSNIESFRYKYSTKTHYSYSCETKCFVYRKDTSLVNDYQECADDVENVDVYEYAADCFQGILDEETIKFYNTLIKNCSDIFNVFFRPAINCDTADFVLISISKGVLLINVCDDVSKLGEENARIEYIKDNLFKTHLKTLKIDSIIYKSIYGCIKTGLFFPNESSEDRINKEISRLLAENNAKTRNSQGVSKNSNNSFKYLNIFTSKTNVKEKLDKIRSNGFKYDYYEELLRLISTNWHSYKEGNLEFSLTRKQKRIVRDSSKRIRVKGVAGCGKTQVAVNRAVEQHLRTGDKVLIITFNIALIQYMKMRINEVPADFSPNMFEITNYHQFFLSMANRYTKREDKFRGAWDDPKYFDPYRDKIIKYKTIIIDEVQDFKEEWLESIINNFLADDGSISVFGDGDQNIYRNTNMPKIPTFTGQWYDLGRMVMRIKNSRITFLVREFAKKYIYNDFVTYETLGLEQETLLVFEALYLKYWRINENTSADVLASNICWILNEYMLKTSDVVVLGQSINMLREIEASYVQRTNQKTMITFETKAQYEKTWQQPISSTLVKMDLDDIRRTAKTHFTTACEEIKFSTIHSFKGWESKTVILLLQPELEPNEQYRGFRIQERENTPALIYTALTRARNNLFILNLGNKKYHSFFNSTIKKS